jgi:hypothetical protein
MHIESPVKNVQKSANFIFDELILVKNYEKLMPESIAKFEIIGEDAFIFGLKGMPEIKLKMKDTTPNSKVILGAASDKIPFTLTINIEEQSSESTNVKLDFEGEFNAMMAMMIKAPITKFLETLSENMSKL